MVWLRDSSGFRVSPNPVSSTGQACLLARNDSLVELRDSVRPEGIGEGNITLTQVS
jgi:hypothetical protein